MNARVFINIGTHAEKEYLAKLSGYFDGYLIGANLLEATSGATASLVLKFSGSKKKMLYLIDPKTYAFGTYIDQPSGELKDDLQWIKSEENPSKKPPKNKPKKEFKRSYAQLASQYGPPFSTALENKKALTPEVFTDAVIRAACTSVVEYQKNRIRTEFQKDEEFKKYADEVPSPMGIFAPYFYIDPYNVSKWQEINLKLAQQTALLNKGGVTFAIVCIDHKLITAPETLAFLKKMAKSGVNGIWLWFSKLYEDRADSAMLKSLVEIVKSVSAEVEVYNLHGGYFSLLMSKIGMTGIAHGVGYGEQKDVNPVIGQSTPSVRYYLKGLHKIYGIPDIERCFKPLDIKTVSDFYKKVCGCVVCKGVVTTELKEFSHFGETHLASEKSKRESQTPAAAKKCRFHYLLSRIEDKKFINQNKLEQVLADLLSKSEGWRNQPTLSSEHIQKWVDALSAEKKKS